MGGVSKIHSHKRTEPSDLQNAGLLLEQTVRLFLVSPRWRSSHEKVRPINPKSLNEHESAFFWIMGGANGPMLDNAKCSFGPHVPLRPYTARASNGSATKASEMPGRYVTNPALDDPRAPNEREANDKSRSVFLLRIPRYPFQVGLETPKAFPLFLLPNCRHLPSLRAAVTRFATGKQRLLAPVPCPLPPGT